MARDQRSAVVPDLRSGTKARLKVPGYISECHTVEVELCRVAVTAHLNRAAASRSVSLPLQPYPPPVLHKTCAIKTAAMHKPSATMRNLF